MLIQVYTNNCNLVSFISLNSNMVDIGGKLCSVSNGGDLRDAVPYLYADIALLTITLAILIPNRVIGRLLSNNSRPPLNILKENTTKKQKAITIPHNNS